MPIVFQQPEPVRGDISTGFGAAQQWSQDYPALQRSQQGIAQAQLEAASLQQRAAAQQQALQQSSFQHSAGLDQRSFEANQHYGLAREQMAHQSSMQDQHFQLQNELMSAQLTRGEQMRLERMRNAVADIQANPDLDPEMKRASIMQIQTGIDVYHQRQARSQAAGVELHNQQMQAQTAAFDSLQQQRTRFMNSSFADRVVKWTDGDGVDHEYVMGMNGDVDYHATQLHTARRGGGGGGEGGTAGTRAAGTGGASQEMNQQQEANVRHQISREMNGEDRPPAGGWTTAHPRPAWAASGSERQTEEDRRFAQRAPEHAPRFDEAAARRSVWRAIQNTPAFRGLPVEQQRAMRDEEVSRQAQEAALPAQQRAQALREGTAEVEAQLARSSDLGRELMGNPRMHAALIQQATQRRLQVLQQQGQQVATTAGGAPILNPQAGQQQQPAAPQPLVQHATEEARTEASQRAFTPAELEGMGTVAQRQAAVDLNTFRSLLGAEGVRDAGGRVLDSERRQALTDNLNRAQRILTRYGSLQSMPTNERRRFESLQETFLRVRARASTATTPGQQPVRNLGDAWNRLTEGTIFQDEYTRQPGS